MFRYKHSQKNHVKPANPSDIGKLFATIGNDFFPSRTLSVVSRIVVPVLLFRSGWKDNGEYNGSTENRVHRCVSVSLLAVNTIRRERVKSAGLRSFGLYRPSCRKSHCTAMVTNLMNNIDNQKVSQCD